MERIFDDDVMIASMKRQNIDLTKMPLGSLSRSQVSKVRTSSPLIPLKRTVRRIPYNSRPALMYLGLRDFVRAGGARRRG